MITMTLTSRTRKDGSLSLHVQTDMPEQPVEVVVVVQSLAASKGRSGHGWPKGFFDRTAGCLSLDPIRRQPQGEFERREALR